MYTPGLEHYVEPKIHHIAYNPNEDKIPNRKLSYIPGLELFKTEQPKIPQAEVHTQWPGPRSISPNSTRSSTTEESGQKGIHLSRPRYTRRAKFWLIGIITAVIVLTILAAIIAGSLAAKKKGSDIEKTGPASLNTTSLTPTITVGADLASSSSSVLKPVSNCSSLKSTFLVRKNPDRAINTDVRFDLKCGHDFKLPLVMGLRMFAFEDCIKACASHSTNAQNVSTGCVAAVYKANSGQPLTCWLKSKGDMDAEIEGDGVDSAFITPL